MRSALVGLLIVLAAPAAARGRHRAVPPPTVSDDLALPNPITTPGGVDPNVTLSDICNGTTKARRGVTAATRAKVMADYNMPAVTTEDYELDHLVPLALGGNNAAANLWPQPAPDYHVKDACEVEMQQLACVAYGTLATADADGVLRQEQREIAEDWIGACRRVMK